MNHDSGGIAMSGWASTIVRRSVVPERAAPMKNGKASCATVISSNTFAASGRVTDQMIRRSVLGNVTNCRTGCVKVPVAVWIVRDRKEHGEADVALYRLHDQLCQIPRATPYAPHLGAAAQAVPIVGVEPSDSEADRGDAVAVGVVPGERFTEHLCARIHAGRPNRDLYVEPLGSGVLADDLTRACDDDPADPRAACCFEDLISAVDVDGHHAPEVRFLVIDTGEVHDRSNVSTGAV